MSARYVIAELKDGEKGGYTARGAVRRLWQTKEFETIVAGPAETGKTWGCLQYADALLWGFPGAHGVMVRKTYADLVTSALRTYLRIIGPDSPIKAFGGEKPQWFDYPNGSRLWVAGLDNAGKVLSTERDFFYVNQAEELILEDWEYMTTRATGRGAVMPYTRLFGDCNPGPPSHWIQGRRSAGQLTLLESRHQDNPTLYDDAGNLTPQGVRTMSILQSLTGARRKRLAEGIWAAAEGIVYEDFDPAVHVIDQMPPGWEHWRKVRAIDFGLRNPFVCQWWAVDGDGRGYRYRELYKTETLVEEHARKIVQLSEGETIEATICDHDTEGRQVLAAAGIPTLPAWKVKGSVEIGIQAVAARLKKDRDGLPRLFLLRRGRIERDERLAASRLPTCTEEEFGEYIFAPGIDGKPNKEEPVKLHDHGCFVAGTLIETDAGPLPIESIQVGDLVLTRRGFRPVVAAGMTDPEADVMRLSLSDGRELIATGNHPVWVEDRGFIRMDSLRYADIIASCEANVSDTRESTFVAIPSPSSGRTGFTSRQPSTRDRTASAACTKRFGRMHTAPSLADTRSTTGTVTRSITIWTTSSASRRTSIGNGIARTLTPPSQKCGESRCATLRSSLDVGTAATRAGSGTPNTPRKPCTPGNPSRASATTVAGHSNRSRCEKTTDSARTNASRLGDARMGLMTLKERAGTAVVRFDSTSTSRGPTAPVRVQAGHALPKKRAVYNLAIEGEHEYFANGVLVHNCDALRYFVSYVDDLAGSKITLVGGGRPIIV